MISIDDYENAFVQDATPKRKWENGRYVDGQAVGADGTPAFYLHLAITGEHEIVRVGVTEAQTLSEFSATPPALIGKVIPVITVRSKSEREWAQMVSRSSGEVTEA